jgi:hypothetical protein
MKHNMKKIVSFLCLPLVLILLSGTVFADGTGKVKFKHKEKSTLKTFPMKPISQDELANAVIDDGLQAPAAGSPKDTYSNGTPELHNTLDSLNLQTNQGRLNSSIDANITFASPRNVPGQTSTQQYLIVPPSNRNYQVQQYRTTPR